MSKKDFKGIGDFNNFMGGNFTDMDLLYQGENASNINKSGHTEDTIKQDNKTNDKAMSNKESKQSKNDIISNENPQEIKQEKPKKTITKKQDENKKKRLNDPTLTTDEKGNRNRNNNYAITIKIDEDLHEYFYKIEWVKMLTERESITKNKYINKLVRQDMLKKLNLKENATNEQVKKAWEKFKQDNNI